MKPSTSVESVLLSVRNLTIDFHGQRGDTRAVENVTFELRAGETVAIVGESGSGKSVTSLALLGLIPMPPGRLSGGEARFQSRALGGEVDLLRLSEKQLQRVRGNEISMIFQEPMTSLNPVHTCGAQVVEALRLHTSLSKAEAAARTIELFAEAQLPRPEKIFKAYPHEISGGQKQRVMIAMAMACQPAILIADEPTTALDVTVQARILQLIDELRRQRNTAVLFITHDLGVVAEIADRILVMYRGRVVEQGRVLDIFTKPQHPYTKGLLACRPKLSQGKKRLPTVADFMREDAAGAFFSTDTPATQQAAAVDAALTGEASQNAPETTKTFPVEHSDVPRPEEPFQGFTDAPLLETGQPVPDAAEATAAAAETSAANEPATRLPAEPFTNSGTTTLSRSTTPPPAPVAPSLPSGGAAERERSRPAPSERQSSGSPSPRERGPGGEAPLLRVQDLHVHFPIRKGLFSRATEVVRAVNGVSFDIYPGETVGLVGESGCGKTTLGRTLLRLVQPTAGSILFDGADWAKLPAGELRHRRRDFQMVFQDPAAALNPMMTVGEAILEPMRVHGVGGTRQQQKERVLELLRTVGLTEAQFMRYPHEFSGGQRQRICIARALALQPKCIICDESVSALDVSVQAQVLNLLNDLKRDFGITYLFITHDLSVARFMSDRLLVMHAGQIVEQGPAAEVYAHPQHEYTQRLLSAIPKDEPADIRAAVARRELV